MEKPNFGEWRYDLEEEAFVTTVYEMAMPVSLWHPNDTYEHLLEVAPHRAYVLAIEYRITRVVDRFKSLNVIDRLLSQQHLPIQTPDGLVTKEQWVRVVLDVLLARLTSIRDCLFLFVSEIYELGLNPRDVTLKTLKKQVPDSDVVTLISEAAEAARDLRDERDRHFHRGEERALGEPHPFYLVASLMEGYGQNHMSKGTGADGKELDLDKMHQGIITEIRTEYQFGGDKLIDVTRSLFEKLEVEYDRRWGKKRDSAQLVASWEK